VYSVVLAEVKCEEPVVEFGHWESGSQGPYTHKATVTFKCNEGYRMTNSATIICGSNRQWGPELPKCEGKSQRKPYLDKPGEFQLGLHYRAVQGGRIYPEGSCWFPPQKATGFLQRILENSWK